VATDPADPRTGPATGGTEPLICNLGNSKGFSNREIVASRSRSSAVPIAVKIGARRAGDPPILVASSERAATELGWRPRHDNLEEMIGSAWAWRRANPAGYAE